VTAYGVALAIELWRSLPAADQWEGVRAYQDWTAGTLSFSKLLAPHNEHRIPLTKLAILADFALFEGRSTLTHWLLLLVNLGLGAALGLVTTRGLTASARALGAAVGMAFLASPVHIPNLILPFHLNWGASGLFALGAFWWTARLADPAAQRGRAVTVALAAAATALAVYSSANGLAVAPLVALAALILPVGRAARTVLVAAAALSVASFFVGYQLPPDTSSHASFATRDGALLFLEYIAAYLGSIYPHDFEASLVIGIVGLVAWASAACRLWWRFRSAGHLDPGLLALFLLATEAVATATMTAFGRVGFGERLALSSRYTTWSVLFWVSLLGFAWRLEDATRRPVARIAALGVAGLLLAASYLASRPFVRQMRDITATIDAVSAELRAGRIVREHLAQIGNPEAIIPHIEFLRTHRLSIFAD
jgi:hypothetical protein